MGDGAGKSGARNSSSTAVNKQSRVDEIFSNSGHLFEDEYGEYATNSERQKFLDETFPDMTSEQKQEFLDAIDFWGEQMGASHIRDVQMGQSNDLMAAKQGELLEEFISKSPKYSQTIYRGIDVDNNTYRTIMNSLRDGEMIDMLGTSSWSSKIDKAEDYAGSGIKGKGIVLISKTSNKAASIQHLAGWGKEEGEVIVSKRAGFVLSRNKNSIYTRNGITYIELDEF